MRSSRTSAKPANAKTATKLLVAMTGKASPAKAAEGDEPVFAYIASLPQPQRGIAERIDALAAKELPESWFSGFAGASALLVLEDAVREPGGVSTRRRWSLGSPAACSSQ
jgi:hypothetical protein